MKKKQQSSKALKITWDTKKILSELSSLTDEKTRARHAKKGAGDNQYGVKMSDIRKLAKKIKTNHELALELWETGNLDARMLATLLVKPESLSEVEIDKMVREATFFWLADWFNSYVVKNHPEKEVLRQKWMNDADPMAARAGWNLTAIRITRNPDGLDLPAILDRLEAEMGAAHEKTQWTMNFALVYIGIHFAEHRERSLSIGEKLGIYQEYPEKKGCTSPYAPIWINEMVRRAEEAAAK